jgi:pimeloyl-ACP methyl ester carboxylesterase
MKQNHPRIEKLVSQHIDKKIEPTPPVSTFQIKTVTRAFRYLGPVFPKTMAQLAYRIFTTPRWRAQHTRTNAVIDAATVVDFSFREHTVKLYEWGSAGNPIILLAHGWESRGTALRMFVNPLVAQGYRVVAYDAIGHGDSTGKGNTISTNAKTIAAIIQHYRGIYGAIGHSFGCSSLVYALQYVDTSLTIEKLIFLAVPHRTKRIIEGFFSYIQAPERVKQAFYSKMETIYGRSVDAVDVAHAYADVKVGALLLIHDSQDDVTSLEAAERVVENWQNAKLLVTEGYGHFRIAKNPDVIKRIVDFVGIRIVSLA